MEFYVYFLRSTTDGSLYIGQTSNLDRRVERHNKGYVKSTKGRRPLELIYFETYKSRRDAMFREWKLKSPEGIEEKRKLLSDLGL